MIRSRFFKLPPILLEAEASVVGAWALTQESWKKVSEAGKSPMIFYRPEQ